MATIVLKDAAVFVGGYDLRGFMNQLLLEYGADAVEKTVFGNSAHTFQGGLKSVSFGLSGFFDAEGADAPLFSKVGLEEENLSVGADRSEGGVMYFVRGMVGEYSPGARVGEMFAFDASAGVSEGTLIRGNLLALLDAATVSAARPGQNLGAVASGQTLYGALHVFGASGTTPTLDVDIESDATGAFAGAETTRISFAQKTAIGQEWATVAGPITDPHWRANFTIGGTTPSFDFAVMLGIQ